MVLFTGDTHGEIGRFVNLKKRYPHLCDKDYIIVCGDFGFMFHDNEDERLILDEISNMPCNICFVDGNHENFNALYAFPVEEWNGGKVHIIRNNIIHLMRGQVFNVANKKIFTMGGAYSTDREFRVLNKTFWNEELPSPEEYREASRNLANCGFKVDYIVTHTAPREVIRMMGFKPNLNDLELTGFLEWVMYESTFSDWFFGHWHREQKIELANSIFHALWFYVIEK